MEFFRFLSIIIMSVGLYLLLTANGKRRRFILLARGLIAYGSLMDYLCSGGILIAICTIINVSCFIYDAKARNAWNLAWKHCRAYFQEYDGME